MSDLFPGFSEHEISTQGTQIHALKGGAGPALLLLHGFPETHLCWWRVAPILAQSFTVIVADLRGYGQSGLPHLTGERSENLYTKRLTGQDMMDVMEAFGYKEFALVGHDRGARVAHRMCLDYPERISRVAFLDIIPSLAMAEDITHSLAIAYYHQYLLAQPAPLPEALFRPHIDLLIRSGAAAFSGDGDAFPEHVLQSYIAVFKQEERFHAACEDYRAAASIDLDHDREDKAAGNKVSIPALVMWGAKGRLGQTMDVPSVWEKYADNITKASVDCAHFIPEEAPKDCADHLLSFFV